MAHTLRLTGIVAPVAAGLKGDTPVVDAARSLANSTRLRLFAVIFVILSTVPLPAQAAVPSGKTFDVVGIVDCGRASGQRCELGDTLKLRTTDVTGKLQTIEIDISWIKKSLPALDQDDQIILEIEEKPGGGYQALRVVTPDKPKKTVKEDDDIIVGPAPTSTVLSLLSIDDVEVTQPFDDSGLQPDIENPDDTFAKAIAAQPATVTATFTVTLSPASASQVTVHFATRDGTATGGATCGSGVDFVSTSGTLTFNPGQTTRTIDVEICPFDFQTSEEDETFFVDLTNPQNAGFGDPLGVGTIHPGLS